MLEQSFVQFENDIQAGQFGVDGIRVNLAVLNRVLNAKCNPSNSHIEAC